MLKNKLHVYLDMDEILTDFIGGACREFCISLQELYEEWPVGHWDMVDPIFKAKNKKHPSQYSNEVLQKYSKEKARLFWQKIDINKRFWYELEFLPEAISIINLVSDIDPDFCIVTSPSLSDECYSGKVHTIRKLLGSRFNNFFINSEKYRLAKPNTVLIDDREENVEKFISNGGFGIMYPARHNPFHHLVDDKLRFVQEPLQGLSEHLKG